MPWKKTETDVDQPTENCKISELWPLTKNAKNPIKLKKLPGWAYFLESQIFSNPD